MISSISFDLNRERCPDCSHEIFCHDKIIACHNCNTLYHGQCSEKSFFYSHVKNQWICPNCKPCESNPDRYNPFSSTLDDKYRPNDSADDELETLSNILKSCRTLDKNNYNKLAANMRSRHKNILSVLFNNIDGNASNFDHFIADLQQYSERFSVISIAETNIHEDQKDLYQITGYRSEYNSKRKEKKKGSGVAIYLDEKYQFMRVEKFCSCSENLETLFVEVTNMEIPQLVGVIYRPPSGNCLEALNELDALMKQLPNENVTITGDFNIDLLSHTRISDEFEQTIYSNNFVPLISLATHEKPGCHGSLIDNILINSTCTFLKSGVLSSTVSLHHPIFMISENKPKTLNTAGTEICKYDYCDSNMENFLKEVSEIPNTDFNLDESGFERFITTIHEKIDKNFKVSNEIGHSKSKRNRLMNPWITNGIICLLYTSPSPRD